MPKSVISETSKNPAHAAGKAIYEKQNFRKND